MIQIYYNFSFICEHIHAQLGTSLNVYPTTQDSSVKVQDTIHSPFMPLLRTEKYIN